MELSGLDLYALKYFFDTVELSSMTDAAAANHITRSAVSQAVARLGEWAGSPLFTHEKRVVELTTTGEAFYRNMKRAYQAFESSLQTVTDDRSLAIGCSASLADSFLLPRLKKLKPLANLKVMSGTTRELSRKLEDGDIHIAISIDGGGRVLRSGRFALASTTGRLTEQIIVTERRPEVTALKRALSRNHTFLSVESWSLGSQIGRELGCAVLLPDFLIEGRFRRVEVRKFDARFDVTLKSASRHLLTKPEIEFLATFD